MNSKKFTHDLIVIGSGTAGAAAATTGIKLGARVAIAECASWGGAALHSAELPLAAASTFKTAFRSALTSSRFGVSTSSLRYNYPSVLSWQKRSHRAYAGGFRTSLEQSGIECLSGLAHFLSPYELSVGKNTYSAPHFIIASGSTLDYGGIIGIESVACLTPATALALTRPPETLAIIGGGATGCELAEYFSSLGTKVTIFEAAPRLLPREDEEVSPILTKNYESSFGIKVLTQSRVVSVTAELSQDSKRDALKSTKKSPVTSQKKLTFLRGGAHRTATFDAVLLATGRKPALDLGLDNAGVKFDKNGITIDGYCQTSMRHILAAGSCTGTSASVGYSAYTGALAATNLLSRNRTVLQPLGFTCFSGTTPAVASVGKSESECLTLRGGYRKSLIPLTATTSSLITDDKLGFIKLLVDRSDHLIGATVMSNSADLLISELALAIRLSLPIHQLASSPVVSTSSAELIRLAAHQLICQK